MPTVYLQDKKVNLEFPDGMSEQEIQDAIEKEFYPDIYQQRLTERSTEDEPLFNRPVLKKDDGTARSATDEETVAMQAMKDLGIDKDLDAMSQGKPPADHFEGQRDALDGGLHDQTEAGNVRKSAGAERVNRKGYDALSDLVIGAANVASGTAKGIDAFFDSPTAKGMADKIDAFSKEIAPTDPAFIDAVVQGFGSTALFLLPGMAVAGILSKAKVGLQVAKMVGTTTMAAFEGLGEAGSVFEDKLKAGATRQEALKAATWTFLLNLPLNAVTDHFAFFLGEEGTSVLKEMARGGFSESLQEFFQGVISGAASKADTKKEMGWDYFRNVPQEQINMDFSTISQDDWGKILKQAGFEGAAAAFSGGAFGGAGQIALNNEEKQAEKEDAEAERKARGPAVDLLARQQLAPGGENLLETAAKIKAGPQTLAEYLEQEKAKAGAAEAGLAEKPAEPSLETAQDESHQEAKEDSTTPASANLGAENAPLDTQNPETGEAGGEVEVKVGTTFYSPVGKPFEVTGIKDGEVHLEDETGGTTVKTIEELNQGWSLTKVNPEEKKVQPDREALPPTKEMSAWDEFTKKGEEKKAPAKPWEMEEKDRLDFYHEAVGQAQRGKPEKAMLNAQNAIGGGVMSGALEHVGDLTHRMTNSTTTGTGGYEFVKEKVDKTLKWLTSGYGFLREHGENLKANARQAQESDPAMTPEAFTKQVDEQLQAYADAHKEIPVFNEVQRLARDAAVALGEKRIDDAVAHLKKLKEYLDEGEEAWTKRAHAADNPDAKAEGDKWAEDAASSVLESLGRKPKRSAPHGGVKPTWRNIRGDLYSIEQNKDKTRFSLQRRVGGAGKARTLNQFDSMEKAMDALYQIPAKFTHTKAGGFLYEASAQEENGPAKIEKRDLATDELLETKDFSSYDEATDELARILEDSKKGETEDVVQKQTRGKKNTGKSKGRNDLPDDGGNTGGEGGRSALPEQKTSVTTQKDKIVPEDFKRIVTAREPFTHPVDEGSVPANLKKGMHPHQIQGVAKMLIALEQGGGILADGTGVGKTTEILAVAEIHRRKGKKVLIVAPAKVLGPKWKQGTYTGSSYVDDGARLGVTATLYKDGPLPDGISVTTYERFSNAAGEIDRGVTLIFDEAHYLKNPGSARAERGMAMAMEADSVLLVTATPADKTEHLLYMQRTGILEGKSVEEQFIALGMKKIRKEKRGRNGKKEVTFFWVPATGWAEVEERLSALFDRMTDRGRMVKRELNMQGSTVSFKNITLPEECQNVLAHIEHQLTEGAGVDSMQGLQKAWVLMHMRRQMEPYKVEAAVEMTKAELAKGGQVVLFMSRVNRSEVQKKVKGLDGEWMYETIHESEGTTTTLRAALEAAGISDITEIHGNAEEAEEEAMARFQSGDARVVIATVESGGTGINLDDRTGSAPRTIIMITSPFDAVNHVQAAGRIWRITTKTFPNIYYLVGDHAVDEWNLGIVGEKFGVLGATVQGELRVLSRGQQAKAETEARPATQERVETGPQIVEWEGGRIGVKNAYEIKDRLKALGARWVKSQKAWVLPGDQRGAVEAILRGETTETEKAIADPMAMTPKNLVANILEEGQIDTEQLKADFPDEVRPLLRKHLRLFKKGGMGLDEAVDILQGRGFPIESDSHLVNLLLGLDTSANASVREAMALDAAEADYAQAHTTGGAPVVEQARTDAETVSKDTLRLLVGSAELTDPANLDFVRAFRDETVARGDKVFASEDQRLTQKGVERIRNALLYAAYGDEQIVKLAAEATDNDMKTLTNSLVAMAPEYAKLKAALKEFNREDLDISADLSAAFQNFTAAKSAPTLDEFFKQQGLFGEMSFASEKLLRAFVDNRRSAAKISRILNAYIEQATGESDPQGSLFEEEEHTRGKEELIDDTLEFNEAAGDRPQGNQEILFSSVFPFLPNSWKAWLTQHTTDPIVNRVIDSLMATKQKRIALYLQYMQGKTAPGIELLLRPKEVGVGPMERLFRDLGGILSKSTHGRIIYEAARDFKAETIREFEERLGKYQDAVKGLSDEQKKQVFDLLESQQISGADPVSQAALRVREILDAAYQHLVTNGIKSGYRDQYVPHIFDGDFWVKVDNAPSIPCSSIGEALEIAEDFTRRGQAVKIVQEGYHAFDAGVANLSPAKFYKMVAALGKEIEVLNTDDIQAVVAATIGPETLLEGDIKENVKDTLTKNNIFPETYKRRFMANLLERFSNNPFYNRDLDAVLEYYLYQVSRKAAQDRFSSIAHRQLKSMPRNEKELSNFIEQEYLPAVLSHPTRMERAICRALQTMFPSATPLGVRKALSRISVVQYIADLGFSLVSAVANASQFWINTASIVGLPGSLKAYGQGIRTFVDPAMLKIVADSGAIESVSSITGRPIFAGNYLADLLEKLRGKQGLVGLADIPLEMFQTVELQNRFASFWAGYNQAQALRGKKGSYGKLARNITPANSHLSTLGGEIDERLADTTTTRNAAWMRKTEKLIREFGMAYGMELVERTQFRHGRENLPLILHSGVLRLLSPYKSFLLSQLKFTTDAMKLWNHPAQTLRFVGLSYFFAGVAGNPLMLMIFRIINWLSKELFGKDLEHFLKAHNLWRGPLSAVGADISGAVAMNLPRKPEDLLGRYAKFLLHLTQGALSSARGESPVFEYRKARRDLLPAQVQRTLDALAILEEGAYVSPISRERTTVDNPYTAALQRVLGFMPPRVTAAFEASEEIRAKKDHYATLSRNMRERLVDAVARGDTMEVNEVFEDVGGRVMKAMGSLQKATARHDKMGQATAMAELIFWKRWIANDDAVKDAYEKRWIPQQVESVKSAPYYLRAWGWQKQQAYSHTIGGGD